jgi:DNA-directed RNA polymerase II subunit RPB1
MGEPLKSIKYRLKGKEGRLRGNLMGKRVDFSARSVITPDPILELDQLGIPQSIAINLTVPEIVTNENISEIRKLICNGPKNWPGAKEIHRPDGEKYDIDKIENPAHFFLEPGYTVERHLRNNDYVIFNR